MTAEVVQLPRAAPRPLAELEARLLGAVLDSSAPLSLFEASGLGPDDFGDSRIKRAWQIARRMAERRRVVSDVTVWAAGKGARLFEDSDATWLQALRAQNTLDQRGFAQLADELRTQVRGRALAGRLEALAGQIREGRWSPGKAAGELDACATGLARDFAPDEDAAGDVVDVLEGWDAHEARGTTALVPTGIEQLDKHLVGFPPRLVFVMGEPSVGKTGFVASMLDAQLELMPGFKVGLFGLEDGTNWLTRRLMARDMGWALRDVGSKHRSPAEQELSQTVGARLHEKFSGRVLTYRHDTITPDELIRRATRWKLEYGIHQLVIDHIGEISHQGGGGGGFGQRAQEQHWERVRETVRRLRNWAIRYETPVVALVHHSEEAQQFGSKVPASGPPKMSSMAGGRDLDRRARVVLALWKKGDALRCTALKANEAAAHWTVEFERLFEAALITPTGGRTIDLAAEAAAERRKAEEIGEERAKAKRDRLAAERAEASAKKAAAKVAGKQVELLPKEGAA